MTFGILYEETFSKSAEVWIEAKERPVAPAYERCHIIGHAFWNPNVTEEQLMGQAEELETQIEQRTGYRAFLVDIRIKQYPPFMTDVDFTIDVPTTTLGTKKFGPIAPLVLIAIIAVCVAVTAILVYFCIDTYIEKVMPYTCTKCTEKQGKLVEFKGWLELMAHKKEVHPEQYDAIMEAKGTNWWEGIPSAVKWIAGAAIVVVAVGLISEVVKRAR